jgi:hypothetical protein
LPGVPAKSGTARGPSALAPGLLDASGEPVLPNRSRVGSIGDVPPGRSTFALRLAIPAGTPGPFSIRNARARGFSAPVRTRAAAGEELLPLEQALAQ